MTEETKPVEKKIGVYICTGCEIGDGLDVEALKKLVTGEMKTPTCKTHAALCAKEGAAMIAEDVAKEGVNRVVVAACSPRVKTDVFNFDALKVFTERCSLREHVVWTHKPNDEDTQLLAEDLIRMSIVRARESSPPVPFDLEINKTILVVGGGLAGLTAANEAAKTGYQVAIVEKEKDLGGWVAGCKGQIPVEAPFAEVKPPMTEKLIGEVKGNSNVKVYTSNACKKISGAPGMFEVALEGGETFTAGAIVLATGAKPYRAEKLGDLGYGKSANVVTNAQVEKMAVSGRITCPAGGKEPSSVVFIQCAGSRDPNHLPYCSSECCVESLKQAKYIRAQNPDAKVYIVYKDLRSPGNLELFYKAMQQDEGIFLTKGEVTGVSESGGKLIVSAENTLLGDKLKLEADMVVLATGMVPTAFVDIDIPAEEGAEGGDGKLEDGKKAAESAEQGAHLLNLAYRQGTDLPTLAYGFPDSHFICFPYETRRTGIYAAGAVRQPMNVMGAVSDGTGAAMKAIQCVELTAQGKAVSPRSGDMTYPDFFLQRCTQCKRCTEECPFGTLDEDEKGTPKPNPTRCRRCAICMGACPERIISFNNYSVHIFGSMIKSIDVPGEEDEKPRYVAFMCENDAYVALDAAAQKRMQFSPMIRIIPLRCLGSMNIIWIADALSSGLDGVLLMGCKFGDDYQCHFIKGSELADRRGTNVQETLKRLVLEEQRVKLAQVEITDAEKVIKTINEFVDEVTELGPNPYKEF